MWRASRCRSLSAPLRLQPSEPARSTKTSSATLLRTPPCAGSTVVTRSVKTACERDETRFIAVEPVARCAPARRTKCSASAAHSMLIVRAPSMCTVPSRASRTAMSGAPLAPPDDVPKESSRAAGEQSSEARRLPPLGVPTGTRGEAGGRGEAGARSSSSAEVATSRSRSLSQYTSTHVICTSMAASAPAERRLSAWLKSETSARGISPASA